MWPASVPHWLYELWWADYNPWTAFWLRIEQEWAEREKKLLYYPGDVGFGCDSSCLQAEINGFACHDCADAEQLEDEWETEEDFF